MSNFIVGLCCVVAGCFVVFFRALCAFCLTHGMLLGSAWEFPGASGGCMLPSCGMHGVLIVDSFQWYSCLSYQSVCFF